MARLDYANARVGARRARLVAPPALRDLLARPSLADRIAAVRALPLGATIPLELGADPLAEVERALREGWRREAAALLADAEGPRARALLAAFLGLEDATAVKAVLRGVARHLPAERVIAAAPPTPELPDAVLRAAAAAETLERAVEALGASGWPLTAALRAELPLGPDGWLLPLEIAVDRAVVERARQACRRGGEDAEVLLGHLEDRVDARNAATLLSLAGAPHASDVFVRGGRRLAEIDFRRLARGSADAARAGLARLFPGVDAALAQPWSADRALERALALRVRREARRRPLSVAVPLAYLADRRAEVRRVALVLRGAELGLPAEEILDLVEA